MNEPLTIWLLNPYHAGSHAAWAEGYAGHSSHHVHILSMDGQFWKWRMQGGAMELAAQAGARVARGEPPDLVLATGMVNLPAFLALTRHQAGLQHVPVVLYMHENQLTYPPPPGTKRDLTYGMIQHLSMLAADLVCFNSAYHLESWFDELPRLIKHFPDYAHLETVRMARAKSQVLPVGCDLERLDRYRGEVRAPQVGDFPAEQAAVGLDAAPLILWNQRWEYDKDPGTMLAALYQLAADRLSFRVALAGENFRRQPAEFAEARDRLGPRLIHYGFATDPAAYARLLWDADLVLSTALHEFFGVSIVEAIYCGCLPVLPHRLSYPELVPVDFHDVCLYRDFPGLLLRLRACLASCARKDNAEAVARLRDAAARFDWSRQAPAYDLLLADVAARARR